MHLVIYLHSVNWIKKSLIIYSNRHDNRDVTTVHRMCAGCPNVREKEMLLKQHKEFHMKHLKTAFAALFIVGAFSLAGCSNFCDCFCDPCGWFGSGNKGSCCPKNECKPCAPKKCDPCPKPCAKECPPRCSKPKCEPCCKQPRCQPCCKERSCSPCKPSCK